MWEAWVQFLSWKLPWRRNGNPLQYSCLENPMDKGAWQATVHEITRVGQNLALSFWGSRTWRWNEVVSLTYWSFAVLVQLLSHVLLFTTPWTAAHQASLSFTTSSSLLKTYVCWVNDAIQLSCPLWSPSLPALSLSQDQSFPMNQLFASGGQSIGASASASVLPRVSSVQSLSRVWLFVTPWTTARQASLSITNSRTLFKLMSIKLVMPFNHLILCHPLLLLPSIFPSIKFLSNDSVLYIKWPKYWNFSFSIRPSNEYSGLISFRMDWLDLLAIQGTLKSLLQYHSSKASIL